MTPLMGIEAFAVDCSLDVRRSGLDAGDCPDLLALEARGVSVQETVGCR